MKKPLCKLGSWTVLKLSIVIYPKTIIVANKLSYLHVLLVVIRQIIFPPSLKERKQLTKVWRKSNTLTKIDREVKL